MQVQGGSNRLELCGMPDGEAVFDHVCRDRAFAAFPLRIPRKSGVCDVVRTLCEERENTLAVLRECADMGAYLRVSGQLRSYRRYEADGAHLYIVAFAREIVCSPCEAENSVELLGRVCRAPIYRKTPFGREICDLMLEVERAYNRRDVLPIIVWGGLARAASGWHTGEIVRVHGRLQSRVYEKQTEAGGVETRTAYEVSATSAALVGQPM